MTLKKHEIQVTVQVHSTDNVDLNKIKDRVVADLSNWRVTDAKTS